MPMETRRFPNVPVPIAAVGQGTWQMEDDPKGAARALRRGLDLGMTHIDTAEMYGSGEVERVVAEAIAGRRDEVFLATKVLPSNASRKGTLQACERSLQRLGTDVIDLYMIHWPSQTPIAETVAAFEELVQKGKIRSYGVSNFDEDELLAAVSAAGKGKIACNQVLYHLNERAVEHAVLPACAAHGVPLVAYSPFGAGDFPAPSSQGGKVLGEIAARHGVTPHAVALRFLMQHPNVVTIPKSSRVDHVEANARAGDLTLEESEIARIDAAFPRGKKPRSLPTA